MTEQQIEPSIIHLDFPVEETNQEPEKSKRCMLFRPHPYDTESQQCGRVAVYVVTTGKKPCGHVTDTYLCQGCWNQVEQTPGKTWECIRMVDGRKCGTRFVAKDAITKWERL